MFPKANRLVQSGIVALLLIVITLFPVGAQSEQAAFAVLDVEGHITYQRAGWDTPQTLVPGLLLENGIQIMPDANTSLIMMCPDGKITRLSSADLLPIDILRCPADRTNYRFFDGAEATLSTQRSVIDAEQPFLIHPRHTIVTSKQVLIEWNAVADAEEYTVEVVGLDQPSLNDPFPADVVTSDDGEVARIAVDLELAENTPYSIIICVRMRSRIAPKCTDDFDWAPANDITFYYVESEDVVARLKRATDILGDASPLSLYARAVLLSQSYAEVGGEQRAAWGEAAQLIERILVEYPESTLAHSAAVYILLGRLYLAVDLEPLANQAYLDALDLAEAGSELEHAAAEAIESF